MSRALWSGGLSLCLLAAASGCGGSNNNNAQTYMIGGAVTGLEGSGLVLRNNGADDLAISANGPFTFGAKVNDKHNYDVQVKTQPTGPGQTCTVSQGTGTVTGANVANVLVACVTPAPTYTVGGTLSGFAGSGNVGVRAVIVPAGQSAIFTYLNLTADGPFTFQLIVPDGSTYGVTVTGQPPGQTCAVSNGSGTLSGASVTNVSLTCGPADTTAPTLSSHTPANSATGVAVDAAITVTFSEAMNQTSLTANYTSCSSGFRLTTTANSSTCVPGAFSFAGAVLTFTPASALANGTFFTVNVLNTASDVAGNPLGAATSWGFRTVDAASASASITTPEDTASAATAPTVTGAPGAVTITIETQAALGTASVSSNKLVYTPNANYNGSDSFQFRANDGASFNLVGTATVTVTPVNDAPTATSAIITTLEDTTSDGVTPSVSDLDLGDAVPDTHTFTIVTQPAHGTASVVSNKLVYAPAANFNGPDSFTFKATDSGGLFVVGTCSVTVSSVNDPPVAIVGPDQSVPRNHLVTLDGSASYDVDDDSLTFTWSQLSGSTVVLDTSDPTMPTFTTPNAFGDLVFQLVLNDGTIDSTPATVTVGVAEFVQVAAGRQFCVAVKTDGSLWSWGYNDYGKLGLGSLVSDTPDATEPHRVGTDGDWAKVATYYQGTHVLALKTDGTLWAWGRNLNGQLGDGTQQDRHAPVKIGTDTHWIAIAAGYDHSLALKDDNTAFAWGANSHGQIGDNTNTERWAPVQVPGNFYKQIAAGAYFSLATKLDETLWGWGANGNGQLGDGTNTERWVPKTKTGGYADWVAIGAGLSESYGIRSPSSLAGTLWALGISPTQYGTDSDWVAVTGGSSYALAQKSDATIWVLDWLNYSGLLGDGTLALSNGWQKVGSDSDWAAFAAGENHVAAVKTDGSLWTWGNNTDGALGRILPDWFTSPIQTDTGTSWSAITASAYDGMALMANGSLWGWGDDGWAIGSGVTSGFGSPKQIAGTYSKVALGPTDSLVVKSDGTLWGAGYNGYGQLGNGGLSQTASLVQAGSATTWTAVALGGFHSAGLQGTALSTWGLNDKGQLGDGCSGTGCTYRPSPYPVTGTWSAASAGALNTLAIKTDGTLWAWGDNSAGQVGPGCGTATCTSPTQVGTDTDWASVGMGGKTAFAIKAGGTLWAWGDNTHGVLGNGCTTTCAGSSTPAQIGTASTWAHVYPEHAFAPAVLAIRTDGTLWAWGQLDSAATTSTPAQVGTDTDWKEAGLGGSSGDYLFTALAVKTDGTRWGWGRASNGQLGDGRFKPGKVGE